MSRVLAPGRRDSYGFLELRRLAGEIPIGTTTNRWKCVFCDGGSNGDRAFSITRPDEAIVLYHCFRASCGKSGRITLLGGHLSSNHPSIGIEQSADTPKVYTGAIHRLGEGWLSYLLSRFRVSEEYANWAGWSEGIEDGCLVCPIWDSNKVRRGTEVRFPPMEKCGVGGGRKTQAYYAPNVGRGAWYRRVTDGPIIIVEDLISALRVSRFGQVFALLGSHIGLDHLEDILKVGKSGILALDKDAYGKSIGLLKRYSLFLGNFRPVLLSKDLKYETDERIKQVLEI